MYDEIKSFDVSENSGFHSTDEEQKVYEINTNETASNKQKKWDLITYFCLYY